MSTKAATVEQYLASLPPDRRDALQAVRKVILDNLDRDYEEGMQYGMIGYYVPHRVFPPGYHCDPTQPLPFAGLASQKNYMSLYLISTYDGGDGESWLRNAWAKAGKKLDMGKSCIRFRKLEDLPLEVVGQAIRRVPARKFIESYQSAILNMNSAAAKAAAKPRAKPKPAARSPRKPARASGKASSAARKPAPARKSARR